MSTFLRVGISHRLADLARLERAAVKAGAREALQHDALRLGCAEALVLSTCSRTELYVVLEDTADVSEPCTRQVAEHLLRRLHGPCSAADLQRIASVRAGDDVVFHLCRVAAGLDSRVVGEVEIQAQLRSAARAATATSCEPHRLRGLVAAALSGAQSVPHQHDSSDRRGLLARLAVARGVAGVPWGRQVDAIVVGAGTMGRQVMEFLPVDGCRSALLSRTSVTGPSGGPTVYGLEELPARLESADVVFVATSAGRRLLNADLVATAMSQRADRGLVIVDLSVPRNVDPDVACVPGVTLLDLDDLADRRERTSALDGRHLAAVEAAAQSAAERYLAGLRSREAGPLISALRERIEELCLAQLRRTAAGQSASDEHLVRMASAVAGAVAHPPTMLMREAAAQGDTELLDQVARAFRLPAGGSVDTLLPR